jgi:hypothetical protein
MSYAIFAKTRPIKTAFLLNETAQFDAMCNGLVKWSTESWGGRQSILTMLNDNSLTSDAWQELIHFDPDIIKSFAPISDKLLGELDARLSPWRIIEPKEQFEKQENKKNPIGDAEFGESIQSACFPVWPTELNLKSLGKSFFGNRPLLLFTFSKNCPVVFRRFIHRNFGTYDQWFDLATGKPRYFGWMENVLKKIPIERLEYSSINDLQTLCAAMERMSGTPPSTGGWKPATAFAVLCELSGIHLPKNYLALGAFDCRYRVIVGSQVSDFVFYWRNCLNEGDGVWRNPFRHCLWVPSELIQEPMFVTALKNWLYHFTQQGNSNSRTAELSSVSLSTNDLNLLADALRTGAVRVPVQVETAITIQERWRGQHADRRQIRQIMTLHNADDVQRITADERKLTHELRPPAILQEEIAMGIWAVDIQIEREPREGGLSEQDWWVLPRKSGRGLADAMFRAPTRISRDGLFAIQIERTSKWPDTLTTPQLKLQLPADNDVMRSIFLVRRFPWDYSDAREKRLKIEPSVIDMRISDAGRKLRGLIDLFGGFWHAQTYWERAFWREIFCRMAGRGVKYDANFCDQTEKLIQKELKAQIPAVLEDTRTKIAQRIGHRVLGIVGERLPGISMTHAQMEEVRTRLAQLQAEQSDSAIEYVAGDMIVHRAGVEPVTFEEFKDGLSELVNLNVLRMGMNLGCLRCRLQHWIKVDALRKSDLCPGCGSEMLLPPEAAWSYRLNPLVHHCVNSRALAVWQALAELAHRPDSFFYSPSAELVFARPINGHSIQELDVLSVTGGELLIGEVKDGDVERSDFEKLAAIAQVVRPDRVAMFVPQDANVSDWFKQFREHLVPFDIRGELFQLPTY